MFIPASGRPPTGPLDGLVDTCLRALSVCNRHHAAGRLSSMRRLLVTILVVLIASSAVAGCSQSAPRRGTVLGIFVGVGGPEAIEGGRPVPIKPIPVPGR